MASTVRPDIVLTDINLPVVSGEKFRDEVKALYPHTPVVAVTAHLQGEKFHALHEGGFDEICTKPFTITQIEDILTRYSGEKAAATGHPVDEREQIDLAPIRAFSGQDEALFSRLLTELAENHARQVKSFGEHLRSHDAGGLSDISHQMRTAYDTLRLSTISERLGSIELHHQLGNYDRLFDVARQLYPDLLTLSARITSLTHQYHTV